MTQTSDSGNDSAPHTSEADGDMSDLHYRLGQIDERLKSVPTLGKFVYATLGTGVALLVAAVAIAALFVPTIFQNISDNFTESATERAGISLQIDGLVAQVESNHELAMTEINNKANETVEQISEKLDLLSQLPTNIQTVSADMQSQIIELATLRQNIFALTRGFQDDKQRFSRLLDMSEEELAQRDFETIVLELTEEERTNLLNALAVSYFSFIGRGTSLGGAVPVVPATGPGR